MTNKEATERPWELRFWKNSIGLCNPKVKNNYLSRIAEFPRWGNEKSGDTGFGSYNESKANAELIVKAVNSHNALIEVVGEMATDLKKAIELLEPFDDPGLSLGLGQNVLPRMNKTLSQAITLMEKLE